MPQTDWWKRGIDVMNDKDSTRAFTD